MDIDRDQLAHQLLVTLPQLRTDAERYDLIRRNLELAFTSGQFMATEDIRRKLGNSAHDHEELAALVDSLSDRSGSGNSQETSSASCEHNKSRRKDLRFTIPGMKNAFLWRDPR